MTIKKETTVTFTEQDKEVLLAMHKWVSDLDCNSIECGRCPFQSFCDTCRPHSEPAIALENLVNAIIDAT